MRIEVVCTGDELLTGLTTETNSPYFMGKLFALGERVARTQVVGDIREDIVAALRLAASRADAVLVSGGLGPTADDLTAECAAEVAGVPLVEDAGVMDHVRDRLAQRNLAFTPNNARQARVPQGAEVIVYEGGTAPMFILRLGHCTLFFVAGVPREYRALVDSEVLPRLKRLIESQPRRVYRANRLLRTVGLAESHLDARIAPLAERHPRVAFSFRTQWPENHLKLLAEGSSQDEADQALVAAEVASREVLGAHVYGVDEEQFGEAVARALQSKGGTVAVAESCTGGKVADLLTAAPGASRCFLGAAVAYANAMKVRWLGVPPEDLAEFGAVSEQVARKMAEGARRAAEATYGLSVTGIAGPGGGSDQKPVGTVHLALAWEGGMEHRPLQLLGDREQIRQGAAFAALNLLRRHLLREARDG